MIYGINWNIHSFYTFTARDATFDTMAITGKNKADKDFHVLIAAAGGGGRLGGELPKQYQSIGGRTILRHTLDIFSTLPGLKSMRVIIDPKHADWYHDAIMGLELLPPVFGGDERSKSIYNGLKNLTDVKDDEIILIHDAARPFVMPAEIERLVTAARTHKAATLAVPMVDTIGSEVEEKTLGHYIPRAGLWALQTPQGFEKRLIIAAHENAAASEQGATDDTALVKAMGQTVKLVPGSRGNFKITTPEDIDMARALLSGNAQNVQTRTGLGYDVHAFDFEASGPVRLCGIDVPHDSKLKGHSDADVGLHTITDAILGAIAEGDIGRHFPPSNNAFKNMDSAIFLKHAADMLVAKGGTIINIDLTLICEAPKITPHAAAMIARVSQILDIEQSRISIKATTTEGLGFTGRREGIAAQAIACVQLPA